MTAKKEKTPRYSRKFTCPKCSGKLQIKYKYVIKPFGGEYAARGHHWRLQCDIENCFASKWVPVYKPLADSMKDFVCTSRES